MQRGKITLSPTNAGSKRWFGFISKNIVDFIHERDGNFDILDLFFWKKLIHTIYIVQKQVFNLFLKF